VAEKTQGPRVPPLAKRGDLLPLGRGFAEKPKEPRARGKGGVTTLQALGETPAERGTHCLPVGVLYAYQVGYGPLPYFGERRAPEAWGERGRFAIREDDREPQDQGRRD
jgi:hypothetical protein